MRRIEAASVSLVLALALTSCAGGTGSRDAPVATDRVDLPRSYRFDPPDIKVKAGTTITWTNNDQFTHTVRIGEEGGRVIGNMKPGEKVTFTAERTGTYRYDCSLHPQNMKGTIKVT